MYFVTFVMNLKYNVYDQCFSVEERIKLHL